MRTGPFCLQAISGHSIDKARANWIVHGEDSLLKRRGISITPTPAGNGCGTRRICVQAVDTSSKQKGASGTQPFVEPQWLFSSKNGAVLGISDGSCDVSEKESEPIWSPSQIKDQKQSLALYCIVISTSKDEKSGFSEPNAGILLSMIGEDGNAFMHRIPGTRESSGECPPRFQRGAVDVITTPGPDLGRLAALWIAPEAGTWRLEKATVTILPWSEKLDRNDGLQSREVISVVLKEMASMGNLNGVFHLFESNEALLGEDSWIGAAELKPSVIQEPSDLADFQEKMWQLSPERSLASQGSTKLREESMKEYENLKLSLLGFSSLLVGAGTVSLAALGRGDLAEGFALGGLGGFLYLLLLQRAVDQLPSSTTADTATDQVEFQMEGKERENESEANPQKLEKSTRNMDNLSSRSTLSGTADSGLRGRIALVGGVALVLGKLAGGRAVSIISAPQYFIFFHKRARETAQKSMSAPQLLASIAGFLFFSFFYCWFVCFLNIFIVKRDLLLVFLHLKVAVVLAALKPKPAKGVAVL